MGLKCFYKHGENYISIKTEYSSDVEAGNVEAFYLWILSFSFLGKSIKLITIEPKSTSIGFELDSRNEVDFGNGKTLLNDISKCDIRVLETISQSEDFKRGFLAIVIDKDPLEKILHEFDRFQKGLPNVITTLKSVMIFCDYDNNWFYLFNSQFDIADLKSLELCY